MDGSVMTDMGPLPTSIGQSVDMLEERSAVVAYIRREMRREWGLAERDIANQFMRLAGDIEQGRHREKVAGHESDKGRGVLMTAEPLRQETAAYLAQLPWLQEQKGRYALIHGDCVYAVYDTCEEAIEAGYDRFGLEPFVAQRIGTVEKPWEVIYQ